MIGMTPEYIFKEWEDKRFKKSLEYFLAKELYVFAERLSVSLWIDNYIKERQ